MKAWNVSRPAWSVNIVLAVLIVLMFPVAGSSQIVLNEIRSNGGTGFTVEIRNQGAGSVNIGGYFLCHFPSYSPLISLTVQCGSLLLAGGGIVVVSGFNGGTAADGEIGLYINGAFSNPASIVDYVEWGSSGHPRSSVAQAAGIWTAGDFVPGFNSGGSIEYKGSGNTSSAWELEPLVTSICAANPPGDNCTLSAGTITTSNPTTICSGDGNPDPVNVAVSGASGNNFRWLITDTAGVILELPSGPPFDFEGSDEGSCLIRHIIYNGVLTGVATGLNVEDISGCYLLSNAIRINKQEIAAGSISTGDATVLCTGDGLADSIDVSVTSFTADTFAWVITDEDLNILSLPASPPFQFDEAGPGTNIIWHLSYNEGLTGLFTGSNIADLTGCYELSNGIEVTMNEPDGGVITAQNTEVCLAPNFSDTVYVALTEERGSNSAWLVTDTSGVILDLPAGPAFTFAGEAGVCLLWHLSYEDGMTGAGEGMNVSGLQGCFDLSNSIVVTKFKPESGTISTQDATTFCIGEGDGDTVHADLEGASGDGFQWAIVDQDGDIAGLPAGSDISFDAFGPGSYDIVHIAYSNDLAGLVIGQPLEDLQGCHSISNPITVTRNLVIGGAISTTDETSFCLLDGSTYSVDIHLAGDIGPNSAWLFTDTSGVILALPPGPPFSFVGADGIIQIWHLSYADGLAGLQVGGNVSGITGCFDLSNSITVVKNRPDGGTINASSPAALCLSDETGDTVQMNLVGSVGANAQWMVVSLAGTILGLPDGPRISFDGFGPGVYVIYHISYGDGLIGLAIGNTTAALQGCWDVSNPIIITLKRPDGGTISTTGETEICSGDNVADPIAFTVSNSIGDNSGWVVTDTALNILALPAASTIDLEGTGEGICLIWHISYNNGLLGLAAGGNVDGLEGCFDLSNPIEVDKIYVDGGVLTTSNNTSICTGDSIPDPIGVTVNGQAGTNSGWIITDTSGIIIAVPVSPPFDFDSLAPGICLIRHISFEDGLTGAQVGSDVSGLEGCFALSDPIVVYRNVPPVSGTISLADTSRIPEFCSGDGLADTISFTVEGDSGVNSAWLVTDEAGGILLITDIMPLDLEGIGSGACLVMHLSYQDGLSGAEPGLNANDMLGCFDLSDPIEVFCRRVEGGIISTDDDTEICAGDGLPDPVNIDLGGQAGSNSAWLITDEEGIILNLPAGPPFDFENSGPGVSLIWHLSFEDGLTGLGAGLDAGELQGCFDLSNPITITRDTSGAVCQNVSVPQSLPDLSRIMIYPNPATSRIALELAFSALQEKLLISVVNITGETVLSRTYIGVSGLNENFELDELPAGHYLLHILTEKGKTARTFILLE